MEQQLELTPDFLLRIVLSWYANPENWSSSNGPGPYSSTGRPAALADAGRAASRAASAHGMGPLVLLVMDLMGRPLSELSRVSGVDVPRLSLLVSGSEPTREESIQLRVGVSVLSRLSPALRM